MKCLRYFLPVFFFLSVTMISLSVGNIDNQQGSFPMPEVAGVLLRTLIYHDVTTLSTHSVDRTYPLVSGDGMWLVYSSRESSERTHVYTAKFDGSEMREIDTFDYGYGVDINYKGNIVLAIYFSTLRTIVSGPPPNVYTIWTGNIIESINVRLAPSLPVVFFYIKNMDGFNEYPRGVYAVSTGGLFLKRIVSPEQASGAIGMAGITADEIAFWSSSRALDIAGESSAKGYHAIFPVFAREQHYLLGGTYDSGMGQMTDLHVILGPVKKYGLNNCVISFDGSIVAYDIQLADNSFEVGISGFETGSIKKVIAKSSEIKSRRNFPNSGQKDDRIFLNRDGSKLLLGSTSYYYDTPTKSVLQLGVSSGFYSTDSEHIIDSGVGGLYAPSMDVEGRRFTFITKGLNGLEQLATLEMTNDPDAAPVLSHPTIDPSFLLTLDRSRVKLTVDATALTAIDRVSAAFLRNGLDDEFVCTGDRQKPILLDDGTKGDLTGKDGTYTNNEIHTAGGVNDAVPGSRVVRYQAETKTADNKRHLSAIDVESLTLTDQVPLIDVVPTSLEFGDVAVGQSKDLTLMINNIGGVQLTVQSLTIDNTRFSLPGTTAPLTISAGTQNSLSVRFSPTAVGQQRGTLTITSSDPARPIVAVALAGNGSSGGAAVTLLNHMMTGGPIPGACDPPTGKTAFLSTDTEAIQWTNATGLSVGDQIRWEWIQPSGSTYRTFTYSITKVADGQACFWDAVSIAGQQAASLTGTWQVRVFIKDVQVLTETFTISQAGGNCPAISSISPTAGAIGATVTVNGTGFTGVTGVRFANNVAATFIVFSDTRLITMVPNGAVSGFITISETNCNEINSPISFAVDGSPTSTTSTTNSSSTTMTSTTVTTSTSTTSSTLPGGRTIRLICNSATPGGTLSIPILLNSLGDENALGFSLTFDPTVLGNPQVSRGSDAASVTLNVNTGQSSQGLLGIALALSANSTFSAGIREIAVVQFTVSAQTGVSSTPIGFGDTPILRQVANTLAQVLTATYHGCSSIAINRGYEADVTPRPNGKGTGSIAITDWVQVGRFAAALDTAATGSEFQRADCAPRTSLGDAVLSIIDWVQAGRYAANLDPATAAGGATAPLPGAAVERFPSDIRLETSSGSRSLRIVNSTFQRGQSNALSIELEAQGNENALGFSLTYDSTQLSFVSAALGSGASGSLLMANTARAAEGLLGFALALSAGQNFPAGTVQVLTVTFTGAAGSSSATSQIRFGDQPIARQVSDATAVSLTTGYEDGVITWVNASAVTLYFPQIADGSGYRTVFILSSLSDSAATAHLEFFDNNGAPLALPIEGTTVTSKEVALSARGVARIVTDGTSSGIKAGWARLTCPVVIGGEAIFQTRSGTKIISEAGVGSSPTAIRSTVYVQSSSAISSGVAICNPNNSAVMVTLKLRNTLGGVVASQDQSLAALGHIAQFITQWFGSAYAQFEGSLEISCVSPVSAVALRYDNPEVDVFTALPVLIIN